MNEQRRIILISLITGTFLMVAKFAAYLLTSSNFILTDAAESIVNVLASAFAFFSIYLSAQPRDENHPYGHGKVEFFSVFVEGILIMIAALMIIFKSAFGIFSPHPIHAILLGAFIIGITGIINGFLGWFLIHKGKTLQSMTLDADGRHLITDMITSIGLVVGLVLIYFTRLEILDNLLSILVAFYIGYVGYKLTRKSIAGLMDEADFKIVEHVVQILNDKRDEAWIDIHNLRAQKYGNELHIDCHLTLPNYFDLNRVHQEVKEVDDLINSQVSIKTEFFIHTDPCIPECCYYCNMPDCLIRTEPKSKDIFWTMENVTRNKKHFE
ncbi:cation diffusion facilitator family transporter [uncultured Mucilaginibacter sp.]|uniref:cation diffusion facilitator family transporter n=1 Tax=uncultured Mucilaginibacter sp. TaxID=797541 RepID=UPI0025D32170|nr:cation diffusion facilitator family transporter [uncultured Mucilaginibacter sp.]